MARYRDIICNTENVVANKIISNEAAADLVASGDTITTSGFVGIGVPEYLLKGLETRFLQSAQPTGLTLLFAAGQGDGQERGLNHLGHKCLLQRVVGGHWGLIPKIAKLAIEGSITRHFRLMWHCCAERPQILPAISRWNAKP